MNSKKTITELTPKELEEIFSPKKLEKVGTWSNGTYFNGLAFQESNYKNFKELINIDFAIDILLQIDDEFFYPTTEKERYNKAVGKDIDSFLTKWNKNISSSIQKLRKYSNEHKDIDYSNYSNEELIKAVEKFNSVMGKVVTFLWSYIYTADLVEEYVLKQIPDLEFKEVRPLYKISAEIINDKVLAAKTEQDFQALAKEFGWYGINLLREKPLSVEDLKEIRKTAKPSIEIKESDDPLLKKLQLFMWLKFERIDIYNYAFYWIAPLFFECLKRIGLRKKYWEVLMPSELIEALQTKKVSENLDSRFTHRGIFEYNNTVKHISLEEYKKYKKIFSIKPENTDILKGKVSCPGNVTGKVKVIHTPDEITKVQEGDILVAPETIVQHEPYMKKTKAMIIEMGGMLSHSAIFSREFNIPTIVGVTNATKILNDGDEVELDANTGIIKILNRK